jgi:hypothetical protein
MDTLKIEDPDKFCDLFLAEYFKNGLGVGFSKRDLDVLIFYLLLKDGRYNMPADIYKVCRDFKLSETKVRNLFQDVQLRYNQYDEKIAKKKFIEVVKSESVELRGNKLTFITFIIRDPLLRQYFEEWVAKVNGFTDSSFNRNLVTVSKKTFSMILDTIFIESKYDIAYIKDKIENASLDMDKKHYIEESKNVHSRFQFINLVLNCISSADDIIKFILFVTNLI